MIKSLEERGRDGGGKGYGSWQHPRVLCDIIHDYDAATATEADVCNHREIKDPVRLGGGRVFREGGLRDGVV